MWDARLDVIERKVNECIGRVSKEEMKDLGKDFDIISNEIVGEHRVGKKRGIMSEEDAVSEITVKEQETSGQKQENKKMKKNRKDEIASIDDKMDSILGLLKKKKISVYAMFIEAGPGRVEDGILYFYLEENKMWHKDHLNKSSNSIVISEAIKEVTGKKYQVKFETGVVLTKNGKAEEPPVKVEEEKMLAKEPETTKEMKGKKAVKSQKDVKKLGGKKDDIDDGLIAGSGREESVVGDEDVMKYFEKKFEIKE